MSNWVYFVDEELDPPDIVRSEIVHETKRTISMYGYFPVAGACHESIFYAIRKSAVPVFTDYKGALGRAVSILAERAARSDNNDMYIERLIVLIKHSEQ